jgi:hypothetical protein
MADLDDPLQIYRNRDNDEPDQRCRRLGGGDKEFCPGCNGLCCHRAAV